MNKVIDRKHEDFEDLLNFCILVIQREVGNIDNVEAFKNEVKSIQVSKGRFALNLRRPENL